MSLKEKFNSYYIHAYTQGYKAIIDAEKQPCKIHKLQNINVKNIQNFLTEFNEPYKQKLEKIFQNGCYIPQEVFNYKIAQSIFN